MQCVDARSLMDDVLDGEDPPELDAHLGECPACTEEWRRLHAVDALLREQPQLDPPPHFPTRVMAYIEQDLRRQPDWRRGLLQVGAIASGTLLAAMVAVTLVEGWRLVIDGAWLGAELAYLARGFAVVAVAVLSSARTSVLSWPMYGLLAGAVALFWFGALVAPRYARRPVR